MNNFGLAPNSFHIFNEIRAKAGQNFRDITSDIKGTPNKLRGNIVDLIKQDLIWCERTKPWVLGKYYLTAKAEEILTEMGVEFDEPNFD